MGVGLPSLAKIFGAGSVRPGNKIWVIWRIYTTWEHCWGMLGKVRDNRRGVWPTIMSILRTCWTMRLLKNISRLSTELMMRQTPLKSWLLLRTTTPWNLRPTMIILRGIGSNLYSRGNEGTLKSWYTSKDTVSHSFVYKNFSAFHILYWNVCYCLIGVL